MACSQVMSVHKIIDGCAIFNGLPSLNEANGRLVAQLALMGEKADLSELKALFEEYGVQSRLGLTLLHNHFKINQGERVVEFGNVSTPWPVPVHGQVAGGITVPRSWRVLDGGLYPYEYGFNIEGEETYDAEELPSDFVRQVSGFLTDNGLADILGICTMRADEGGRVERTVGRVSVTVPIKKDGSGANSFDTEAVWSFDCQRGLESAIMKLARLCDGCRACDGVPDVPGHD